MVAWIFSPRIIRTTATTLGAGATFGSINSSRRRGPVDILPGSSATVQKRPDLFVKVQEHVEYGHPAAGSAAPAARFANAAGDMLILFSSETVSPASAEAATLQI